MQIYFRAQAKIPINFPRKFFHLSFVAARSKRRSNFKQIKHFYCGGYRKIPSFSIDYNFSFCPVHKNTRIGAAHPHRSRRIKPFFRSDKFVYLAGIMCSMSARNASPFPVLTRPVRSHLAKSWFIRPEVVVKLSKFEFQSKPHDRKRPVGFIFFFPFSPRDKISVKITLANPRLFFWQPRTPEKI